MVQITQTDDEVKIVIELNRLITRKPDITLLPTYLKFNNPPIFFERHLSQEIDDMASYCRIFKNEARITLIKKQHGIWPELFMTLSKEELFKRRLEISDQIVERNKERDKKTLERYEHKRRSEIDKEVRRESAMRERVKQFQESACREALMVGVRKETHTKQLRKIELPTQTANGNPCNRLGTPAARPNVMAAVRSGGKINVNFSKFSLHTPKRESQQGAQMPFTIVDNCQTAEQNSKTNLDTLQE